MTNFKVLEHEYGLLRNIREFKDVLLIVQEFAAQSRKKEWMQKRDAYFQRVGDTNAQIVQWLEERSSL